MLPAFTLFVNIMFSYKYVFLIISSVILSCLQSSNSVVILIISVSLLCDKKLAKLTLRSERKTLIFIKKKSFLAFLFCLKCSENNNNKFYKKLLSCTFCQPILRWNNVYYTVKPGYNEHSVITNKKFSPKWQFYYTKQPGYNKPRL